MIDVIYQASPAQVINRMWSSCCFIWSSCCFILYKT